MVRSELRNRGRQTYNAAFGSAHGDILMRDGQVVERLGLNQLVAQLLEAGLEVAEPIRDRGVDLIAYAERTKPRRKFLARPIQLKAAWTASFRVDVKYRKASDLIIAFVWYLGEPSKTVTYALSSVEVESVATAMGWDWKKWGSWTTTSPSVQLRKELERHRMSPEKWWRLVTRTRIKINR